MLARVLLAVGLIMLTGCSTMNEEECLAADWKLVGFEDGSRGKTQSSIGEYRKDCAKVNVVPNLVAYQQGHLEGVRQYCIQGNGYRIGVNGGSYNNVCPPDLEPAFLAAFRHGHELYTIRRQIRNLQKSIQQSQSNLDTCQNEISATEKVIISSQSTTEQRIQALSDLKDLQRAREDYGVQLDDQQHHLEHLQDEASNLQLRHQRLGF